MAEYAIPPRGALLCACRLMAAVKSGNRSAAPDEGAKIRLLSGGGVPDTKTVSDMKDGKAEFVFPAAVTPAATYTIGVFG